MNSLITIETNFLNSENLIAIILVILVLGLIYSITEKIQRFFLKIYDLIKKITNLILFPINELWKFCYKKSCELISKIIPPSDNPKFDKFGGRSTFIFVITITALSPILIIIGLFLLPNSHEFAENFFMGMPPFNIIMLSANGFDSIFQINELLMLVLLNAITLIFLKNQDECSKGIQIYYCMIFLIFSGCLSFFLSPVFSNPTIANLFDINNIYKTFIEDNSEKFILTRILYIITFIPILYAFVATVCCAVRDLLGLLAHSIKPFVTFFAIGGLLASTMNQSAWFTPILIIGFFFTAFWAQHNISFEKDLFSRI